MIPESGTPLNRWALQPDDFGYLDGHEGNGYNLVSLAHTWFGLLGDSPVDNHKPYRICASFYRRLSYYPDLRVMIKEFSALANLLMQGIRIDRVKGGPEKYDQLLFRQFARTPIFREYMHWYRTKDAVLFDYIVTFLLFGKKAELIDESLYPKALEKTLNIEEDLRSRVLRPHILEDLRRLVALSQFRPDLAEFRPKFGPGQVAEVYKDTSVMNKIRRLCFSSLQTQVLGAAFYAQRDMPGRFYMIPDVDLNLLYRQNPEVPRQDALYRIVPKDEGTARSICFEPSSNMVLQQGLLGCSLKALARSRLRIHIDLRDQSKNRDVAEVGARLGLFVTTDLEGASDRLMWILAEAIFPDEYVALLNAVSSSTVEIRDGKESFVMELARAFPMGNAMNSFIQSYTFMCIMALASTIHRLGKDVNEYITEGISVVKRWPLMSSSFRAFGDDLTSPESLNRPLQTLLTELGFVVNVNKTFSGDQAIRESCGGFFRGRTVIDPNGSVLLTSDEFDPLRFKIKGLRDGTYDSWLGLISLANRALKKNYFSTWCAIRDLLPEHSFVNVPEDGEYRNQSCALIGNTQEHDPKSGWYRYNTRLQRHERRVLTGGKEKDYLDSSDSELAFIGEFNSSEQDTSDAVPTKGLYPMHPHWQKRASAPCEQSLERYYLGNWLYTPSETEGAGSPPRDGLAAPSGAVWIWTPYGTSG